MQSFYPADYHASNHLAPVMNSSAILPSAGSSPSNAVANASSCLTKFGDIDPLNAGYPAYGNNWSNGYNNYQYQSTGGIQAAGQAQYPAPAGPPPPPPHGAPAMLIYPQVYSTVNQNQIHLHLHGGADKIEQYLAANESEAAIGGQRQPNANLAIMGGGGGGGADNANVIMDGGESDAHQRSEHETANRTDQEVADPSSVWRPY